MPSITMYTNAGCSMCKVSEQLLTKLNPELKLTKVSIDTEPELMNKLMSSGVRSLPVLSLALTDAKATELLTKANGLLASRNKSFEEVTLPAIEEGLGFYSLI